MKLSVKLILLLQFSCFMGSKGCAVLKALASHQCGPVSNPSVDAICGLNLLFSERFFSRYSGFPSSSKTNIYSNSSRNQVDEEPQCGNTTPKKSALYLSVNLLRPKY